MPNQKKIDIVNTLTEEFKKATAYVFVDYRGLTVSSLTDLRTKLWKIGSSLTIAKNTLIEKATQLRNDGPTAILFAGEEALAAIKTLSDFARTHSLTVKNGFFEGRAFDGEQILQIAQLPSRAILIGRIARGAKSPLYRLAQVLSANQRNLVIVLNGIASRKG